MSLLAVAGAGALMAGLASTMYNVYRAERDIDYQDQLQGEIFSREDNAVQRRMADLQQAGLNPNLAAGSAANAGGIVGRSTTPQTNFGAGIGQMLDAANAVSQLKKQETENQILNNQKEISEIDKQLAYRENQLDNLNYLLQKGSLLYQLTGNTDLYLQSDWNPNKGYWEDDVLFPNLYSADNDNVSSGKNADGTPYMTQKLVSAPFLKILQLQNQNQQNAAAMLQNNKDWQTADRIFDYANTVSNLFSSGMSGFNSYSSGRKNMRYWR